MLSLVLPVIIGVGLGAALGYFGQCTSGTCPLTSTWWRGALYGGVLGALFAFTSSPRSVPTVPSGSGGRAATNLIHVTAADFDAQVLRAEQPVVVDFYATWCPPCQALAPTFARLADEFAGRVKFVKVDVDANPDVAARFEVSGLPTLVVFQKGKPVDVLVGLVSAEDLRRRLHQFTRTTSDSALQPARS